MCKHADGVEGLRRIAQIYEIDRGFAKLSAAQRKRAREVAVRPLVEALFVWAERELSKKPPRGLVNSALGDAVRKKVALGRFLEGGKLRLNNNHSERAARRVALGRRTFLFVGGKRGGENLAILYSLVASCEQNGKNPLAYLTDVLLRIADHPASKIDELLPDRWQPPERAG